VAGNAPETFYNVYRQVNGGAILLLDRINGPGTTDGVAFIDDGRNSEIEKQFPTFGYCNINYPRNLKFIGNNTLNDFLMYNYSYNFLMLVIYEDDSHRIKASVKNRIDYLLRQQI